MTITLSQISQFYQPSRKNRPPSITTSLSRVHCGFLLRILLLPKTKQANPYGMRGFGALKKHCKKRMRQPVLLNSFVPSSASQTLFFVACAHQNQPSFTTPTSPVAAYLECHSCVVPSCSPTLGYAILRGIPKGIPTGGADLGLFQSRFSVVFFFALSPHSPSQRAATRGGSHSGAWAAISHHATHGASTKRSLFS